jgi:hypothetical protein
MRGSVFTLEKNPSPGSPTSTTTSRLKGLAPVLKGGVGVGIGVGVGVAIGVGVGVNFSSNTAP